MDAAMSSPETPDHDQRFKTLLAEFFREFLTLFFPEWAERFDLGEITWLTQEVFPNPPQGERRALDLVARLRLKPGVEPPFAGGAEGGLVLVHLEVESNDRIAGFRRRFFDYYVDLRRRYDLPVWPIGLFLRVGLDGIGWTDYSETFWGRQLLEFTFAYVGLPALNAETYLSGESLLGVALTSLMRVPRERRVELHAEGLDRIARSRENDWRRFLLAETLQAYSDLDPAEWQRLQTLLVTDKYREARPMTMTYYERGQLAALQRTALSLLEAKFGALTQAVRERLEGLSIRQLDQLLASLFKAESMKELGLEDESQ
jgi:hypothetical protein